MNNGIFFYGLLIFLTELIFSSCCFADNYFIRQDGGSAQQCNGRVNVAYPGRGKGKDCAWDHPFQALPPGSSPRISSGDTLTISSGEYRMGYGASGAGRCSKDYPWDCFMAAIPSGVDEQHPTRIMGEMKQQHCVNPPMLWGTDRSNRVVNLKDSSYVELSCLDITDKDNCIEFYNPEDMPCDTCVKACRRDRPPYGNWASTGIYAENSNFVTLNQLRIHGLSNDGIHAGRLSHWTINNTQILANGWAGWNGDLGGPSANSGTITFRNSEIAWNGCSEDWKSGKIIPGSCWGQGAGGYGDGIGLAKSGGKWRFEQVQVHHNSSDGIDLLYLDETANVEVSGLMAYANAGNQLKISGNAKVENSVLIGSCRSLKAPLMKEGDLCRARGNTLSLSLFANSQVELNHNTITGEGDCLMIGVCRDESCDGTERVQVKNSLYLGKKDWQEGDQTCLYWYGDDEDSIDPFLLNHNLVLDVKYQACPGKDTLCNGEPGLVNDQLDSFDGHLKHDSQAINNGNSKTSTLRDIEGNRRDKSPDIGAYEKTDGL